MKELRVLVTWTMMVCTVLQVAGKLDRFHIYGMQTLGALLIGCGLATFVQIQNDSRDSLVRRSWLLSRVLVSAP